MNAGSKLIMGIAAGALAGAIVGILFAPEAGTETRKKIGEGSKDLANNLKEKFGELVDGIAEKYESAREGAADLIGKGKEKVAAAADEYTNNAGLGTDVNRPSFQS